MICNTLG